MDPASPEKSRPGEAMADVPQKPSRGHCCDGLFHPPHAHVWCSAFSSSATTGVRSCISMGHEIPMLFGWYSNCEKQGPTNRHTDSCYSIETQSLEPMWFWP